jgi:hypothetical protein
MADHADEAAPRWWLAYGAGSLMVLIPLLLLVLGHWHSV